MLTSTPHVLVTGANGQLGRDVVTELLNRRIEYTATDVDTLDITDKNAVRGLIGRCSPDAVIHCAAYTNVDKAEEERVVCAAVNVTGASNVAKACALSGAKLVYISSDYVYGETAGTPKNESPLTPDSPTNPVNWYGRSKLEGERAAAAVISKLFIVRTSWLFGENGSNFVKTMTRLGQERDMIRVVSDQTGSPTYTKDLVPLLCDMAATEKYGVYNASNEGFCSWAEFARQILRLSGSKAVVEPVTAAEYGAKATRQLNSRLSKDCLDRAGFGRLPHWRDALERFMRGLDA